MSLANRPQLFGRERKLSELSADFVSKLDGRARDRTFSKFHSLIWELLNSVDYRSVTAVSRYPSPNHGSPKTITNSTTTI